MRQFVPAGDQAAAAARYFVANVGETADKAQPKMKQFLETAIRYFDLVQPCMNKQLADELAHFVELLSEMWKDDDLHLDNARDNDVYREAYSLMTQNIPYPLWFVLASAFGPGHSSLAEIRDALSKAWDSEIPTDTISYPACNSASREFELFGMDPKLIPAASPTMKPGPIVASTVHVDLTSPNAANPVADTSLKASQASPFNLLSRNLTDSESGFPDTSQPLRMRDEDRGPRPIYNKTGPFSPQSSVELASRGISSSSNVNRDSDDPRTETSPEPTFSAATPGSASPRASSNPPDGGTGTNPFHFLLARDRSTTSTPAMPTAQQSTAEIPPLVRSAPVKRRDMSRVYSQFDKDGKHNFRSWLHSRDHRLEAKIDDARSGCRDGLDNLTTQTASLRTEMNEKFDRLEADQKRTREKFDRLETDQSSLEGSFDRYKDMMAEEALELEKFAERLRLSLEIWKEKINVFEEETETKMTNLKMQHADQKSTAERLTKELQSTNEKLADTNVTNAKLADECEQRKTENVALQSRIDGLEDLCQDLIAKYNETARIVGTKVVRSQGHSVDNEEGDREKVNETSSSNLNKRTLPPHGISGGAAKRSRCD